MKFLVKSLVKSLLILLSAVPALVSAQALAAAVPAASGGSTSTETQNVNKSDQASDEADQLITNRQLRASSGSLSKWSINTFWSYSAGAINAPFDVVRPNITAAGDTGTLQSLYGEVGARYRVSAKDSISASIGLNMISPFHFGIETDQQALKQEFDSNARKLTANDPTLSFRHIDRMLGNLQSVSTVSLYMYTTEFRRNAGFRNGVLLSQNFMYEVGKSGLSLGTAVNFTINTFGGDADTSKRPGFILGFYPALEYVINDSLNVRTVSGVWVNEFRRDGTNFERVVYQSVGLGVSVSRDVFLYPNIQFLPGDLRADKTNLGLNANVNLF